MREKLGPARGWWTAICATALAGAAVLVEAGDLSRLAAIVYEPNVPALDGRLGPDSFGSSIASLGDLDGNGVADLAVGATFAESFGGAAWILFLGETGSLQAASKISRTSGGLEPSSVRAGDFFGAAVAGLGDIDGDAVPDLAVGGDRQSGTVLYQGAIWIVRPDASGGVKSHTRLRGGERPVREGPCAVSSTVTSSTTITTTTLLPAYDEEPLALYSFDFFGRAAAATRAFESAAVRLAVGAPGADSDRCETGAVWLIDLDTDGTIVAKRTVAVDASSESDAFGSSLAWLGDLDGDGTVELAVGAPIGSGCFAFDGGAVWIVSIDEQGSVAATAKIEPAVVGEQGHSGFGRSLAVVGDLDGDGAPELAVGDSVETTYPSCEGRVWILFLDSDGAVKNKQAIRISDTLVAPEVGDVVSAAFSFGDSLAGVGDLDGDGTPDLAIGVPTYRPGPGEERGAIFIAYLTADGGVKHVRRIADETPNTTTTSTSLVTLESTVPSTVTSTTIPASACGDVDGGGDVDATDALIVLRAAVGIDACDVCDMDCSGGVVATDALLVLRAAVGASTLVCECL